MMLGAPGAFACFAACTGVGLLLRARCQDRARLLLAWGDALGTMGLLLEEERLPLPSLLDMAGEALPLQGPEGQVHRRLQQTARLLEEKPRLTLQEAYQAACGLHPIPCEKPEERQLLTQLFSQLGVGTAAMRGRGVMGCERRLRALQEKAEQKAEGAGKLYAKLGMLGGLMLAIALW